MEVIGYDILSTSTIDKNKSWFHNDIVYTRQILPGYKYFMEAVIWNERDKDYEKYFIFAREQINNKCHRLQYDSYGRYKIKTTYFAKYFAKYFNNTNFDLELYEHTKDYDVYRIS